MTKPCDGCRASNAAVYCTADMASICLNCDLKVHGANKLASRHERVWICEVCEHAPAAVICKADAAALCSSCDNDIHSANPLASRHERVAVTPFFECPSMIKVAHVNASSVVPNNSLSGLDLGQDCWPAVTAAAAATAAAPTFGNYDGLLSNNVLDSVDSFLELGLEGGNNTSCIDALGGYVPEPETSSFTMELFSNGGGGRPSSGGTYSLSPTKSSSVAAVVPDSSSSLSDISKPYHGNNVIEFLCQFSNNGEQAPRGIGREERVLRYKEKRKNRKFEKTVRYASRKAYAEIRPRVKGRFVKRSDGEQFMLSAMADSVVPSF